MSGTRDEYNTHCGDFHTNTSQRRGPSSTEQKSKGTERSNTSHHRIAQRPVIHPVFEAAQEYTLDPFWKTKLMHAARGKLPRGFSYRDGYLIMRGKNKLTTIPISPDPQSASFTFISFMKESGIYSDGDVALQQDRIAFKMSVKRDPIVSWNKVPYKMRDSLVEDFIKREASMHKLNKEQLATLRVCLFLGIKMKVFGPKQIKMRDQEIEYIEGLVRCEDGGYDVEDELWANASRAITKKAEPQIPGEDSPSQPLICHIPDKLAKHYMDDDTNGGEVNTQSDSEATNSYGPS